MLVLTITALFGSSVVPVGRLAAAQFAADHIFGDFVHLQSIGEDTAGTYRVSMPEPEEGEHRDNKNRWSAWVQIR